MSESDTPESPVAEGELPPDGVVSLLSQLESLRATGVLAFEADGATWEVALVAGQIATDQPERPDGADAVEKLLTLREGHYSVYQRLPQLPVSSGGAAYREGSLAVHVPADLMNYCERAGLTGKLVFEAGTKRAEVLYDGGELSTIRLDGVEDLNDVFSWEDGSFRVDAVRREPEPEPAPPESTPAPKPLTEPPLLSVVEVALASIIREREERRPGSRTGPPLPPMPAPMAADTLPPPARGSRPSRRDATVKVIYLGGASSRHESSGRETELCVATDKSTRHVHGDITAEMVLPQATRGLVEGAGARASDVSSKPRSAGDVFASPTPRPPRKNTPAPQRVSSPDLEGDSDMDSAAATTPDATLHGNKPEDDFAPAKTAAWVAAVFLLVVVALAILAHLPTLE